MPVKAPSIEDTPLRAALRAFYKDHDSVSGPWTASRIRALCEMLRMNEDELAAFIRVSPHQVKDWIRKDKAPAHARLLLCLIEGWLLRTRVGDSETKIFPTHLLLQ